MQHSKPTTAATINAINNRNLLLNKLHLDLNVNSNNDGRSKVAVKKIVGPTEYGENLAAAAATITTVPQQEKQFEQTTNTPTIPASSLTSSSLLNPSATALAKFNRIIDNTTHSASNGRTQQPPVLSSSLQRRLAAAHASASTAGAYGVESIICNSIKKTRTTSNCSNRNIVSSPAPKVNDDDDNQTKRNDVHYLLKQLNSFSDIEEIAIVDMEQMRREQHSRAAITMASAVVDFDRHSPTATSLVITSPTAISHKGIRRYASLHYDEELHQSRQRQQYQQLAGEADDLAQQQQQLQQFLMQFDDYIFQSSHYLETNCFATAYRGSTIPESSSHEFRPSTKATSSANTLDAPITPSSSCVEKTQPQRRSSCGLAPFLTATKTAVICHTTAARLTEDGMVRTELSDAEGVGAAKKNIASNMVQSNSGSSSSNESQRMPFFRCCYRPINRWRERRATSNMEQQKAKCGSSSEHAV